MPPLNTTPNASILVVDDYEDTLPAMSELLQGAGFHVRTARNGLDALNKVTSDDSISLVLLLGLAIKLPTLFAVLFT